MSQAFPTAHEVFGSDARPQSEQQTLEKEFFACVVLRNRTVKTTCAERLNDLNALLDPHIRGLSVSPVDIMDIAISSGISTAEWYRHLAGENIPCRITATDLTIETVHSSLSFAPTTGVLRDGSKHVLHFDLLGKGYPPHQSGFRPHLLRHVFATSLISLADSLGLVRHRKLSLLCREFSMNGDLVAVEDDLLRDNPRFHAAFHVVRVANLLNRAYFSVDELRRLVANVVGRIRPGGLLAICRTNSEGINHGSIFKIEDSTACVVDRLGDGSEIEDLVLAHKK